MTNESTVAGVDGCPGGWIAVMVPDGDPAGAWFRFVATFAEIVDAPEEPSVIAVDMPIGLPDRVDGRGRPCEVAARARLGPRQSSVFRIPARAAVMETDYRAACAAALATSDPPRAVAKQAFNLFPKIREIDAILRAEPVLVDRIYECHPELAFWAMRGGRAADQPKKVKSRPNPDGLAERRGYLAAHGFAPALFDPVGRLPGRAGPDDLIDAAAAAWTALRIARGGAECFPPTPPRDAFGLPMAIRA